MVTSPGILFVGPTPLHGAVSMFLYVHRNPPGLIIRDGEPGTATWTFKTAPELCTSTETIRLIKVKVQGF